MKKIVFVYFIGLLVFGLNQKIIAQDDSKKVEISPKDSIEYEITIFDAKFDAYLASIAKPKSFYSDHYYKSWNIK